MGNPADVKGLRPFFSYYGAKWRASLRYPSPIGDLVVEPFAGSAGYSTRFPDHNVILVDLDEKVCGVWDYIIGSPSAEILSLPLAVDHVDDLQVCQEAKWLIGFWLNHGAAQPCKTPSSWMRAGTHSSSFWGEEIRHRVATQSDRIRHWKVIHGSYEVAPDAPDATIFVDPPYSSKAGRHYRHEDVDFDALGRWCLTRSGLVIACEQQGAEWLPFSDFGDLKSTLGSSRESIWVSK